MSSACGGCGARIVWGETAKGVRVPLDPKAPVYRIDLRYTGSTKRIKRDPDSLVSHFATCPNANDFSASKKQQELL